MAGQYVRLGTEYSGERRWWMCARDAAGSTAQEIIRSSVLQRKLTVRGGARRFLCCCGDETQPYERQLGT